MLLYSDYGNYTSWINEKSRREQPSPSERSVYHEIRGNVVFYAPRNREKLSDSNMRGAFSRTRLTRRARPLTPPPLLWLACLPQGSRVALSPARRGAPRRRPQG